MNMIETKLRHFWADTSGTTAIEYALIASLISVTIIASSVHLGTSMKAMFDNVATKVN